MRACRTRLYLVEGWEGVECGGWSSGNQARSVGRKAEHFMVDLHADRILVRREQEEHVSAEYTFGRGWTFHSDAQDKLRAALVGEQD